jgi:hypothetical protein
MFKYLDKLLLFLGIYIDNTFINDGIIYEDNDNIDRNNSGNKIDSNKKSNDYKLNIKNKDIKLSDIVEGKNKITDDSINITDYDINYNEKDDGLIDINCFCSNHKNSSNWCCSYIKILYSSLTTKKTLSFIYSFYIFIVLSSIPGIYIYDIIINNNKNIIANASFTILQPILYIIIQDVFRKNFFQRIYNYTHHNNNKKIHYCLPDEKKLVISIIFFSIVSSIISFYLYLENDNIYIYDNIDTIYKYILSTLYIFNSIYGRTIISLNIHIFFYVFLKLIKDLKYTYYKINPDNINNNISSTPVADLLHDIITVRHNFNKAIYMLEYIYISATICGGISIAYIIDYELFTSTNLFATSLYIFVQLFFISIIAIVEKQRQKLLILVKSTRFSEKYIFRRNDICKTCIDIENSLNNYNTDDLLFNNLNINHSELFRKNINKKKRLLHKPSYNKNYVIVHNDDSKIKNNSLNVFDYVKCSYEWVKYTGNTLDWIVLTKALSEEWDAFSLLGIRFDNGSAFKKCIAASSAFVTIISYLFHYFF